MPPPGVAPDPEEPQDRSQPRPRPGLGQRPCRRRVDRHQPEGNHALAEVGERARAGLRETPPECRHRPAEPDRPVLLEPHRGEPQRERHREEGSRRPEVGPRDPAPPPPGVEQQEDRKHRDRRLAEHRRKEPQHRPAVGRPRRHRIGSPVEVDEGVQSEEKRRERQGVLLLGNPRHGFDGDRMDREEEPAEPAVPDAELPEDPPDEERRPEVEGQADGVVAPDLPGPEVPLHPLERGLQRKVIHPDGRGPRLPPAPRVPKKGVAGDFQAVVPKPAAAQRRPIGRERGESDEGRGGEHAPAAAGFPGGHGPAPPRSMASTRSRFCRASA